MSDQVTPPTQPPADNGGNTSPAAPPATPAAQPLQGGPQPAAEAAPQPYRAFANQAELDTFVKSAKTQAERSAIRKLAKDLGFEDADEMREALGSLRQAQGGSQAQPTTPDAAPATSGANEATRLQTAIQVAAKLGLPATLIPRLQGSTPEEMEADAQTLIMGLVGYSAGKTITPGIPPPPSGNTPVTFTTTQLKDAEFVRNNAAAIQAAARDGRIVRS